MRESGKPRFEAEAIEVLYACEMTRFATGRAGRLALREEVRNPFLFPWKRASVLRQAVGVVGVIGPWNWPLLNNYGDAVAPLAMGNAVVLKPSPVTPLTSLLVERLWREEGLPENVFQVVVGGGEIGEALVDSVDMVFFTGSQATGRKVAQAAGARLVPCVLELGGNSPMVVLGDADLERAARAAVWSGFAHSGQVCIRTERVIVESSVHDRFVERCLALTNALRQGHDDPDEDRELDVGAVTFAPQMERAERQIAQARGAGARVASGGQRRPEIGPGFFAPTVLVGVTPDMDVSREETFGPVLPVIRAANADEAIRIANETSHGLSAAIWSGDGTRAAELARRLDAGTVCVNDVLVNYMCVEAPLGGIKASGLGVRHGIEGLRQFCRIKTVVQDRRLARGVSAFAGRHLQFPYTRRVLRVLEWVLPRLYR
jgi:acyl-CoA reductase-like NAD-dependent aldehyde dehydrogenase